MDIVGRAVIVFVVLWVVMRLAGKRQLSELSAFEFIVIIAVGEMVGPVVMQEEFSLTAGFLAISTLTLLAVLFAAASRRSSRMRKLLEGSPTVLVEDGAFDERAMRAENLSQDEVLEAARGEGIFSLGEVRLAILEVSGRISFLKAAPTGS